MPPNQNDEEPLTEREPQINTISEIPSRPFSVTVEVPLFLVMLAVSLSGPAISNILLYRTCVHTLSHSEEECLPFLAPDRSNTSSQLEEDAQKYTTIVMMSKLVIEAVGPAIMSIFLGVWSDTYGRKPLIVWPLLGMSFTAMGTVVFSMLDNLGPWYYLLTAIPFSLTGGYTALFTGAYTYLSDITSTKDRSIRMLLLEISFGIGSVVGAGSSSFVLKAVGNVWLLLINAVLFVLAYAFTNIFLIESLNGALPGGLLKLFDIQLAREMIDTCFKRRPSHGRAQIIMLAMCNGLTIFILYGVSELKYMYTREKLHWAVKQYTVLEAADVTSAMSLGLAGVALAQRLRGPGDLALALLSYVSATAGYGVLMLATKSWHMYLASAVSSLKAISAPLVRAHLTKAVPGADVAGVFALVCALESLCPLLAPLAYNGLYSATIAAYPGAIYALSAGINMICIGMVITVKCFIWRASYEPLQNNG